MCKKVMDKFKAVIQKDWLKCFKFGYNRQPAQNRRMSLVRPVDLTAVTGG